MFALSRVPNELNSYSTVLCILLNMSSDIYQVDRRQRRSNWKFAIQLLTLWEQAHVSYTSHVLVLLQLMKYEFFQKDE